MAEQVSGADCATVIGADVVIKGDLTVDKGLRVDGQIEGSISTKSKILVGKSGQLKADIKVGTLIVEGKITGTIQASERVQVETSGQVYGEITAAKLLVDEGATFVGKVNVGPEFVKESRKEDAMPAPVAARMAGLVPAGNGNGRN